MNAPCCPAGQPPGVSTTADPSCREGSTRGAQGAWRGGRAQARSQEWGGKGDQGAGFRGGCSGLEVQSTESRPGSTVCAYPSKVGVGAHGAEPETNPAWLLHLRCLWGVGVSPTWGGEAVPSEGPSPVCDGRRGTGQGGLGSRTQPPGAVRVGLVTGWGVPGASPPPCPCPRTLTLGPPCRGQGVSLKTDGPSYESLGTGRCVSPAQLPCWV